jgi:hypothetical protein
VSLVRRRRIALALEHMSQMASAVGAHDLRPLHSKSAVGMSGHSARNSIEERRPATARLELVLCRVNGCVAAGASIGAGGRGVLVILARERCFGAFVAENAELLCCPMISIRSSTSAIKLSKEHTLVQLHLPLLIGLLHRVRHVSSLCGMEKASYERDRGHGIAKSDSGSGGGQRERRWSCSVESGVAESVECADEVGEGWDTHGETCKNEMVRNGIAVRRSVRYLYSNQSPPSKIRGALELSLNTSSICAFGFGLSVRRGKHVGITLIGAGLLQE